MCGIVAGILVAQGCIERKPLQVAKKESPVTARLAEMIESERRLKDAPTTTPQGFQALNRKHRAEIYHFLAQAVIVMPEDLYAASEILGRADVEAPDAILLAHHLAATAADKGLDSARLKAAMLIDRYHAIIGRPQLYGTQYITDSLGVPILYPVDSSVSDSQRVAWGVQPLDSLRANLERSGGGK
ncbi:MAG: hypothetical protein RBT76_13895 [candidate division Zixibacteria bacterium]|jgi:hypothetical protein|nr:hypothetical protein [candidate division Zixibacteria bacterium]